MTAIVALADVDDALADIIRLLLCEAPRAGGGLVLQVALAEAHLLGFAHREEAREGALGKFRLVASAGVGVLEGALTSIEPCPQGTIALRWRVCWPRKAVSMDDRTYYLNQTLDEIMAQLDPEQFFRANRQFIISRKAVKDLSIWFGNKLAVNLTVPVPEKTIVSKARAGEFKTWFAE